MGRRPQRIYGGGKRRRIGSDANPPPLMKRLPRKRQCMDDFEILNKIGEGSYGEVYRVKQKNSGEILALKKQSRVDAMAEIKIMKYLYHPSIVDFKNMVMASFEEGISMVMEYVENDLQSLLEMMKKPFTQSEVKCLMLQLLEGVLYLHSNGIVHRDLKTSNLLLNNYGELKICDFGMAYRLDKTRRCIRNTETVVTLGYRAPELLLKSRSYSKAIDMWSVGCIMAELFSKKLLFRGGKEEIDQIGEIFKILGIPDEDIWPGFSKLPRVKRAKEVTKLVKNNRSRLRNKFPALSSEGIPVFSDAGFDLLRRLLMYDTTKRITAEEALDHPWFCEVPLPKPKALMPTFLPRYARTWSRESKL